MAHIGISKFGCSAGIAILDAPLDLWSPNVPYPFPAAAAATTIVSDDADDDGAPVDTGARTVNVEGLDANYEVIEEDVTLNGVSAVTLANEYLRVYRVKVLTAGSSGANEGTLLVKHGATVIAQVDPLVGQTLMAVYTVPVGPDARLLRWWATSSAKEKEATVSIRVREFGGAWQTKQLISLFGNGVHHDYTFPDFIDLIPAKADIAVRVVSVTGADTNVYGGFDIVHQPR